MEALYNFLITNKIIFKVTSLDEYMRVYEGSYGKGMLWDFSKEDVLNGSVELDDRMLYFVIEDRVYESPLHISQK